MPNSWTSGAAERQDALQKLEEGDYRCVICSKIWEKGIDVPSVMAAANMKGESTEIGCRQTIGRPMRLDEKENQGLKKFYYLDFKDPVPKGLNSWSKHREDIYESEDRWPTRVITTEEAFNEYGRPEGLQLEAVGADAGPRRLGSIWKQ